KYKRLVDEEVDNEETDQYELLAHRHVLNGSILSILQTVIALLVLLIFVVGQAEVVIKPKAIADIEKAVKEKQQQSDNSLDSTDNEKEVALQALQDIKDLVKAKEEAKNAIKALANAKRDQINSNPDLTLEQKAKAL
ncbi:DUF1542 domain-containing protein, partial [Staphylococcus aureus]|uniref:DUF1542 domain-containing protein n=1 Tax=Staphylococcus aureus TaxID=1280 RepID=UPI00210F1FDD